MRRIAFGGKWCVIACALVVILLVDLSPVAADIYDGQWHDMGSGWSYIYVPTNNSAFWRYGTQFRFGYNYSSGQWYDWRNSWSTVGSTGMSSDFIGDGKFHDLKNGWSYAYVAATSDAFWKDGTYFRLAYNYGPGQWWDYRNSWSKIGISGISNAFVGDGKYHDLGCSWQYAYVASTDDAFWRSGSTMKFAYNYVPGQWWDYLPSLNKFGKLGQSGISNSFIGDAQWHQFGTDDSFFYTGTSYFWKTGGTCYYGYNFTAQQWYKYSGSSWQALNSAYQNVDTRYIGSRTYVESSLRPDEGTGAPAGYKDIVYDVYQPSAGSFNWGSKVANWRIYRPGSDNAWSGGNLNVVFCNTIDPNTGTNTDHNVGAAEYTVEDTIVFKADMENSGLSNIVNWMTFVRDYYGKQISNVGFAAHGNTTGWEIGSWVDTSNYTTYQSVFTRWGSLMTADGQILSYHCNVGQAATMLNAIASWTGCDIFANTDETMFWYYQVNSAVSGRNDSIWNHNFRNVYFRDENNPNTMTFEYRSNSAVTAHQVFQEIAYPSY